MFYQKTFSEMSSVGAVVPWVYQSPQSAGSSPENFSTFPKTDYGYLSLFNCLLQVVMANDQEKKS